MARWYPNGDGNKCCGSFLTARGYKGKDGKVICHFCGRWVGLRNPKTNQMAQHKNVPGKDAKCQRIGCGQRYIRHQGDERRCPNTAINGGLVFVEHWQPLTASGRISVSKPEMQFIRPDKREPVIIVDELSKLSPEQQEALLAMDYSKIEERLVAYAIRDSGDDIAQAVAGTHPLDNILKPAKAVETIVGMVAGVTMREVVDAVLAGPQAESELMSKVSEHARRSARFPLG